jgi:hypothetical protein
MLPNTTTVGTGCPQPFYNHPLLGVHLDISMSLTTPHTPRRSAIPHRWLSLLVVGVCAIAAAGGLVAESDIATSATVYERLVRLHPPSDALLSKHTIPVHRTGTLAIDPADACALLARTNLLELVQQQYARQLPAGQSPEFVVRSTGTNTYAYVNRHGHRSAVTEVGRRPLADDGFAILFYMSGERDFGLFESLAYVTVSRTSTVGHCRYEVVVHAYPHGRVRRFIARHLGLVERYFRDKTLEMETLVTDLCQALCKRGSIEDV